MIEKKHANLKRLINPDSIAFIGTYHIIRQGIENVQRMGFDGTIYAVHQSRDEINGIQCVKSIKELPFNIDAAFVAVNAKTAVEVVKELQKHGTAGVVCYAAGFSEIGESELQKELVQAAGDMALVGPNCYGFINFFDSVPLWPDRHGGDVLEEGIALISQSGNLSLNLTMTDRSLPLGYAISIGNQASLEIADFIDVLVDDERVKAIGLHIEGIQNIERFIQSAKHALQKQIPIIALKTGVSELGSKLTESHTSSLAGSNELYDSLFKRLNICRVNSLVEMLETLKLFSITGNIIGNNIGVLTCSGGESTIVADFSEKYNIKLPPLGELETNKIAKMLTQFEHVGNPLDYNTSIWGDEEKLFQCFREFMKGPFDAALLIIDLLQESEGNVEAWIASLNAFMKAKDESSIPQIVVSVLPEGLPASYRQQLVDHNITPLQGVAEAFNALNNVMNYHGRLRRLDAIDTIPTTLLLPSEPINMEYTMSLNEWEGKQIIAKYGILIPKGKLVDFEDEQPLTEGLEPPFAVKKVSSDIVHKTDVGAVKLFLQSEEDVVQAIENMNQNIVQFSKLENKYLVEEMVQNYVAELNIGIKRDDQFGLAMIISMGGELVNLLNDSATVLLPSTRGEIKEALQSLKGFKLLEGFRGRDKGDVNALLDVAEAVASLAEDYRDEMLEMDLNPLLVLPEGKGVVAVDSFIRLTHELEHKRVL